LTQSIIHADDTEARIAIVEDFLFEKLTDQVAIDHIVTATIDTMYSTGGALSIRQILASDKSKRRQLERKFTAQVGISPKQLSKVIRLQSVLSIMLNQRSGRLSQIAYDNDYYDQAHFNKDFKEFTGMTPKEFSNLIMMKWRSLCNSTSKQECRTFTIHGYILAVTLCLTVHFKDKESVSHGTSDSKYHHWHFGHGCKQSYAVV
jgi:AraC-like DNA-binding protein